MTKDEAREAALINACGLDPDDDIFSTEIRFSRKVADEMFDAGYEFANRWNVIERDGMPPFDGDYLCTVRLQQECGNVWIRQQVLPCINNSFGADVIAWRSLSEPYKGE